MLIEEYIKNNELDLYGEWELDFVEPDNSNEAHANLEWVMEHEPSLEVIALVVRSYYNSTINWEDF